MPRMSGREPPGVYWGLTPNQVVAYNLARAREWKGWTQTQAAEALAPYLGHRWSKPSFSQAERSFAGRFVRQFTADEIVAFARCFDLPITWFFLPPPPASANGPIQLEVPDAPETGEQLATLLDLVFGEPHHHALLELRVRDFLALVDEGRMTTAQQQIGAHTRTRVNELTRASLGDLEQWQQTLRAIANHLEDLEQRARFDGAEAATEIDTE